MLFCIFLYILCVICVLYSILFQFCIIYYLIINLKNQFQYLHFFLSKSIQYFDMF